MEDGYKLLSEFNSVVLSGKATPYGAQFMTREWVNEGASLYQGHYSGPGSRARAYALANGCYFLAPTISEIVLDNLASAIYNTTMAFYKAQKEEMA